MQFCLSSHKSFIDIVKVSWQRVQYVKLMNVVGGLLQTSVAAKYHKGLIEVTYSLAQVRIDFTSVFSSSFAAAAIANIGPNSGTQLCVYLNLVFSEELKHT